MLLPVAIQQTRGDIIGVLVLYFICSFFLLSFYLVPRADQPQGSFELLSRVFLSRVSAARVPVEITPIIPLFCRFGPLFSRIVRRIRVVFFFLEFWNIERAIEGKRLPSLIGNGDWKRFIGVLKRETIHKITDTRRLRRTLELTVTVMFIQCKYLKWISRG